MSSDSHSHHMHHMMGTMNETTTDAPLSSTVATVMQAIMTTTIAHGIQHFHHQDDSSGHSAVHDNGPTAVPVTNPHSHHVGSAVDGYGSAGGDHMPMYFHFSTKAIILFKEWEVSSVQGMVFSVIAVLILSALYEGLKYFREYLFKKYFSSLEYSSVSVLNDDGKTVTEIHKIARNRILSWPHAVQTVLHTIQMLVSFALMLIVMTYNVWLLLAVAVGMGIGYFFFGWRKATVVDITDHCH